MDMEEYMSRRLKKQKQLFEQLGISMDAQQVHEKHFKYTVRGYDPKTVDQFLDQVVKDYERFYAHIVEMMEKQHDYEHQIRRLKEHAEPEWNRNFTQRKHLEGVIKQLEYSVRELNRLHHS